LWVGHIGAVFFKHDDEDDTGFEYGSRADRIVKRMLGDLAREDVFAVLPDAGNRWRQHSVVSRLLFQLACAVTLGDILTVPDHLQLHAGESWNLRGKLEHILAGRKRHLRLAMRESRWRRVKWLCANCRGRQRCGEEFATIHAHTPNILRM